MSIGPIEFEMKVHFIGDDGKEGATTCSLSAAQLPTMQKVMELVGESLRAVGDSGLRLMNADEFFNRVVIRRMTGRRGNFAIPKEWEYDVKTLAELASAAYAARPKKSANDEEE